VIVAFVLAGLLRVVPSASAQSGTEPYVPCAEAGLPGCDGPENVITEAIVPNLALLLLRISGGLALVFIVIAGIQLMLSYGDESKIGTQKKAVGFAMGGLILAIMSQALVSTVVTYDYGIGNAGDAVVGGLLVYAVDIALTFMNVIFVIMVTLLGIRMVASQGKTDEFNSARKGILWVIAGAVLVNVSHMLVRIVLTVFGV
jgi:hypothetical protein